LSRSIAAAPSGAAADIDDPLTTRKITKQEWVAGTARRTQPWLVGAHGSRTLGTAAVTPAVVDDAGTGCCRVIGISGALVDDFGLALPPQSAVAKNCKGISLSNAVSLIAEKPPQ